MTRDPKSVPVTLFEFLLNSQAGLEHHVPQAFWRIDDKIVEANSTLVEMGKSVALGFWAPDGAGDRSPCSIGGMFISSAHPPALIVCSAVEVGLSSMSYSSSLGALGIPPYRRLGPKSC